MKYKVTITEMLKRDVFVEADSVEEAEELVGDGWSEGKYILVAEDFDDVRFEAKKS